MTYAYPQDVQDALESLPTTPTSLPATQQTPDAPIIPSTALDEPDITIPTWMHHLPSLQETVAAVCLGGAILVGVPALMGGELEPPSPLGIGALALTSVGLGAAPFVFGRQQARANLQDAQRKQARESQEFRRRINEYVAEVKLLRQTIESEKQTALQIGNEALAIRNQLTHRDQQIASQQKQISELTQSIESNQELIFSLRITISKLETEMDEYDATVAQWENDFNRRLAAEIETHQQSGTLELEKLKRQLSDTLETQQLELLRAKRQIETQSEKEIQAIRAQYSTQAKSEWSQYYSAQIKDLEADLADIEAENAELLEQLELMQQRMIPAEDVEAAINQRSAMLDQTLSETENLTAMCGNLQRALDETQDKLSDALMPVTFCPNSDYTPGNVLISYLHELGYIMDAVDRTSSRGKDTYWLRYRGNSDQSRHKPPSILENAFALSRQDFEHHLDVKAVSELKYNASRDLYSVSITSRHATVGSSEIERLWSNKSKFNKIAINHHRFRLTGATGASKSPMARNILGAKFAAGQRYKIYRFDPSAGSEKDFWRIAPNWTAYSDIKHVTKCIKDVVQSRKGQSCSELPYIYFVLDEIDNAVANGHLEK